MSDPKRLLHGAGGPLAAQLLAAGRDELPSDAAMQRALAQAVLAAGAAASLSHSALGSTQVAAHTAHAGNAGAAAFDAAASGAPATGTASTMSTGTASTMSMGTASTGAAVGGSAAGGVLQGAGAAAGAAKLGVSVAVLTKWVGIAAVGIGVSSAAPTALRWLEPPGDRQPAKLVAIQLPASASVQSAPPLPVTGAALPALHAGSAVTPQPAANAVALLPAADRVPAWPAPSGVAALPASGVFALPAPSGGPALPVSAVPALPAASGVPERGADSAPEALVRPRAPSVRPRQKAASALDELRLVDSAREALQSGDAARALDVLRHYEARIASPQFQLEVAVLRMNALDRLGRTDLAQQQARQLLTRPMPEQQAARARAILDRQKSIE